MSGLEEMRTNALRVLEDDTGSKSVEEWTLANYVLELLVRIRVLESHIEANS